MITCGPNTELDALRASMALILLGSGLYTTQEVGHALGVSHVRIVRMAKRERAVIATMMTLPEMQRNARDAELAAARAQGGVQ